MRKLNVFALAALTALLSVAIFIGTSAAFSPPGFPAGPSLASDLPFQSLPSVALDASTRGNLQSLIIPPFADRYGIGDESYSTVRQLAATAVGPLYVVSGTKGLCVVLQQSVACGNPDTAEKKAVAIFVSDPQGKYVGGGVLAAGVNDVTVGDSTGTKAAASRVPGGFTVAASGGLMATGPISLSVG